MSASDSLFLSLPTVLQRAIDDAFDTAINPNSPSDERPSKRRKVEPQVVTGGGFLIEDTMGTGGGGFMIEEDPALSEAYSGDKPTQILFDLIPSALQRLDLPPDDDEVLSVFRNAASGWTSSTTRAPTSSDSQQRYVGREDWRSVCAVLLEHRSPQDLAAQDESNSLQMEEEGDDGASDEYFEQSDSAPEAQSDVSDDEYQERLAPSSSRRRTRGPTTKGPSRRHLSPTELAVQSEKLTSRQRQTCRDAFALFFPDVATSELQKQRIMIKDIQRAAQLLNEKLKADDMVEMLDMFSTSPDKSMNFDDFSRVMIAAKLA